MAEEEQPETCAVCLDALEDKFTVKLKCGHQYHTHCIMPYFAYGNAICLLCRALAIDPSVKVQWPLVWIQRLLDTVRMILALILGYIMALMGMPFIWIGSMLSVFHHTADLFVRTALTCALFFALFTLWWCWFWYRGESLWDNFQPCKHLNLLYVVFYPRLEHAIEILGTYPTGNDRLTRLLILFLRQSLQMGLGFWDIFLNSSPFCG